MNGWILCGAAGLAGSAAGWLLPQAADRFLKWKLHKKGQTAEPAPAYTGLRAKLLCLLANGLGWALCCRPEAGVTAIPAMVLWTLGAMVLLTDLRRRMIPNELLLAMLVPGITLQLLCCGLPGLLKAFVAMVVVLFVYMQLGNFMGLYKIGAGDVKLNGVMALTLGVPCLAWGMVTMAAAMFLFCGAGLLLRKMTLKSMLPFGPFLVPGLWVGLLVLPVL